MRHLFFMLLTTLFFTSPLKAQIPIEVMVGHEQVSHDFFFFKDLDAKKQYNLFTQGRFTVHHDDKALNTNYLATYLTRNISKKWGISVGGASSNLEFAPLVAVSYTHISKDQRLVINLFPSLLLGQKTSVEFSGILMYSPEITEKWSSFNQLLFATNLTTNDLGHQYSVQQIRVGLDYKQAVQFGLGVDLNFLGSNEGYYHSRNIGFFVRTVL